MLYNQDLSKILFLDIETVPQKYKYEMLDDSAKELWQSKISYKLKENLSVDEMYDEAGIYAEFGKIVCISVGVIRVKNNDKVLKLKSYYGHEEKTILENFKSLLDKSYSSDDHILCAHNGKDFDFPYIARRMVINGLRLPSVLNIAGKKPWEIHHLDTMELWKFGAYRYSASLNLLTHIFNIPTPKDDISGADVAKVYWEDKDLERISRYCEKDVVATVQLFLRYRNEQLISDDNMEIVQ